MEQDLAIAMNLLGIYVGSTSHDLQALFRLLARYGHELRDWQRHGLPNYFAQQIRNRLPQGRLTSLVADVDAYFANPDRPSLNLTWATNRTDPALRVLTGHEDCVGPWR